MDNNQLLLRSSETGNLEGVKTAIKNGANVNMNIDSHNNDNPLLLASKGGHWNTVKILLKHGANPNVTNYPEDADRRFGDEDDYYTPIMYAIRANKVGIVEMLLDRGAEKSGFISLATLNENLNLIKMLLEKGLDINDGGHEGESPIVYAVYIKNFKIVKFLLENGANPAPVIHGRQTDAPLLEASKNEELKIVELLLTYINNLDDICVENKYNETALSVTNYDETPNREKISKKISEKIRQLVFNGVDATQYDKYGEEEKKIIDTARVLGTTTMLADNSVYMNVDTTGELVEMMKAEFREKEFGEGKKSKRKRNFKREKKNKTVNKKK
jgi:hypothetical protein